MPLQIVTIGAYGFTSETFFAALLQAKVDILVDVRWRRAVRGTTYTFANSERLQATLQSIGIRYLHRRDLAPNPAVRAIQEKIDKAQGVLKRGREQLAQGFVEAYGQQCLAQFDAHELIEQLGLDVHVVALFCVEGEPNACHRSLIAQHLSKKLEINITHIKPGKCVFFST